MKVLFEPKEKHATILIVTVLLIALAIIFISQLDYQASACAASPTAYGFWLMASMFMFGLIPATIISIIYWLTDGFKIAQIMFWTILVSTALLIASNLEDCMYFLFGARDCFPTNTANWNWMLQAKLFGFWDTTNQVEWTIIFLLILALFLTAVIMKLPNNNEKATATE
jgi:hypothetical protein